MTFTPIGSQTKKETKLASKSISTSHIAQNINDNQYITDSIPQIDYRNRNTINTGT